MAAKNKTTIEQLREIRDQISLDTMDMSFDELKQYFTDRRKKHEQQKNKKSYKNKTSASLAAEPKVKYGKH